jgi:NADH:ubiquinone oxidoreductase subunit E
MKPRVASPKVNATLVLRNRGAGEQVDSGCQGWGAIDLLKHLLKRHAQRRGDEQTTFGVVAKRCLDKCEHAPIVLLHTPDGTAGMPAATVAQLDEALAQVL